MSERRITLDALMDVLSEASVGELGARIDYSGAPEDDPFTVLGIALNVLLSDLEFRNAQREAVLEDLRRLNAQLETRVKERTAQLVRANADLESFSYTVAHDLRAPLRGIHALTELALREEGLPEAARDELRSVVRSAEEMSALIDTLLRFARADREPLRRRHDVDLSDMARRILADLQRAEPERRVRIEVQPGIVADCDERLVYIALQNLLDNAWKYTSRTQDARIAFRADVTPEGRVFRVIDNGAGFEPRKAHLLFRPFQRLHPEEEYGGSGVGLATVRRIVEEHGGRIWAEARPGAGATFSFTLAPEASAGVAAAAPPAEAASTAGQRSLDHAEDVLRALSSQTQPILTSLLVHKALFVGEWFAAVVAKQQDAASRTLLRIGTETVSEAVATADALREWDAKESASRDVPRLHEALRARLLETLIAAKDAAVESYVLAAMGAPTAALRADLMALADTDRSHADELREILGTGLRAARERVDNDAEAGAAFGAHHGRLGPGSLERSVRATLERLRANGSTPTRIVLSPPALRHLRDEGALAPSSYTVLDLPVDVEFGWVGETYSVVTRERVSLAEVLTSSESRSP